MNVNTGDIYIGNLTINIMNDTSTSTHRTSENLAEQFIANQRAAEHMFRMIADAQEAQRVREQRAEQDRKKRKAHAAALQEAKQAAYNARLRAYMNENMPALSTASSLKELFNDYRNPSL
ncbi:hypothetical protein [Pseudomonas fluorescens]|uniref:hypothetical protein n=1 Tax=Pseudomonas fluorescens TaxID=294 RepID=UPI00124054DA|nr:hypothetical protein [Pseudomonas fluorescens]